MAVRILAINDFHGALEPPEGANAWVVARAGDPVARGVAPNAAGLAYVPAGGAAYLATHVARLRAGHPNTVVVSAGDLTGASPLVSNLFDDEPTIQVMNRIGLDIEAVGNHDFDRGVPALRRFSAASDGPADAAPRAHGAAFAYLAANVFEDSGQTVFPAYAVREFGGARIAFIGETLRSTPSVTAPAAVADLSFGDEVDTVNALVPELERLGVCTVVLLLHQGGRQGPGGTYDSCEGLSGDLLPILDRLSPAVEVVISGHTHQAYRCTIAGRLVTSAASYGRLVTAIDLLLDPARRRVLEKGAHNVPVTRDVVRDGAVAEIVAEYEARARPIASRVVGYVARDIASNARLAGSTSCETPLGSLIADAMQLATGADVAFMNPGGVRADLVAQGETRAPHVVTYSDVFAVQPFQNRVVVITLTGAQILKALERQFGRRAEPRILQVSHGFSYRYEYDRARRTAALAAVTLRGKPLDPEAKYRVAVPSFLAAGGDGFDVIAAGKDAISGPMDVDALATFLARNSSQQTPLVWRPEARITGDGCK